MAERTVVNGGYTIIHSNSQTWYSAVQERFVGVETKRSRTDTPALVLLLLTLLLTIILLIICISHGYINNPSLNKDKCGNVCGKNNSKDRCGSPQDMTDKIYLLNDECVERCANTLETIFSAGKRCVLHKYLKGINISWKDVFTGISITLLFTALLVDLFLKSITYFVWFVIIAKPVICFIGTILCISLYGYNYLTLAALIYTVIVSCIIIIITLRLNVTLLLLREVSTWVKAMPLLYLQPLVALFILSVVALTYAQATASILNKDRQRQQIEIAYNDTRYELAFQGDIAELRNFTLLMNLVSFLWVCQIVFDVQQYLTSSVVAKWFFARYKLTVQIQLKRSGWDLWNYHAGTVALGSMLMTTLRVVRFVLFDVDDKVSFVYVFDYCLHFLQIALEYLMMNIYIITAINGCSLRNALKKAYNCLRASVLYVFSIKSIGILIVTKLLIVSVGVLVGLILCCFQRKAYIYEEKYRVGVLETMTALAIVSWLIVTCFSNIVEMVINTLYICVCIDCEVNDGEERPYFMSIAMMEFITRSLDKPSKKTIKEVLV